MRDTDLAYLAGLIDGEGHVRVQRGAIHIVLCMADVQVLEWCHARFGGNLSSRWKSEHGNSRPRRMWFFSRAHGLEDVAWALLPYLVLKRREMELLLVALAHAAECPRGVGMKSPRYREWRIEMDAICAMAHDAMLERKSYV